jgi:hypothetical protein
LPGYITDIKIFLNRNVNEGVSWNLPGVSISFVINDNDALPLSKDEFFNHFKSLNAPQKEFKQQLLNLKLLLREKESLNFNELDFNISEDEVLSSQ